MKLRALILGWLLCCGLTPLRAQTPAPPGVADLRFLIVVDTSSALKRSTNATLKTVYDIVATGAFGQMRPGDVFGLWTFNSMASTNAFPLQAWNPDFNFTQANALEKFVQTRKFERSANLDPVVEQLVALAKKVKDLNIYLITDGKEVLFGTPFDLPITTIFFEYERAMTSAKTPFVVSLVARDGVIRAWSVDTAGNRLQTPSLPRTGAVAQFQPPPKPEPKPEPKPVVIVAPPTLKPVIIAKPEGAKPAPVEPKKIVETPKLTPLPATSPKTIVEAPKAVPAPAPIAQKPTPSIPPVAVPTPIPITTPPPKSVESVAAPAVVTPPKRVEAVVVTPGPPPPQPAAVTPVPPPAVRPAPRPPEPQPEAPVAKTEVKAPAPETITIAPKKKPAPAQIAMAIPTEPTSQSGWKLAAGALILVIGLWIAFYIFRGSRRPQHGSLISRSYDKERK